jgi:hypothetical protein
MAADPLGAERAKRTGLKTLADMEDAMRKRLHRRLRDDYPFKNCPLCAARSRRVLWPEQD